MRKYVYSGGMTDEKPHILVVDDDERLRQLLSRYLVDHGFLVSTAPDAKAAREILTCLAYDLLILDVMMPGEDGLALTKYIKTQSQQPILLLTARSETEERIEGLEAGADDYLSKPFEPKELLLRVQSILRRLPPKIKEPEEIKFGKWTVDLARNELKSAQDRVTLTQAETALLRVLSQRPGQVVTREELAEFGDAAAGERSIDVQVTRLRKKIEDDSKIPRYLQTVRGKGYVLWTD